MPSFQPRLSCCRRKGPLPLALPHAGKGSVERGLDGCMHGSLGLLPVAFGKQADLFRQGEGQALVAG